MSSTPIITTSWDDGHPLDLRLADMLWRNNLKATFYIPRSAQTGTMSATQVRELSERFEIGAHTLNHVFLDSAGDAQARAEIRDSRKWVEDVTGKPCAMFCPPGGKFAQKHLRMMEEAGFAGVRTVEFFSFDLPRRAGALRLMPTTLQANPNGLGGYARNIAKRLALRNAWNYVRYGRSTDWVKLCRPLLQAARAKGGVFHLWGHSWELDEHRQWDRLQEVLQVLGESCDGSRACSNGETAALCP